MYYTCTIYNELYAYISYILPQSMLHDIHWTFIEPGDFHRTISRDMARHANAMRMPCECHANAMRMPCECHANAMRMPCECHANAMRCQRRSRVALTWKLSMDCCSGAEVLWTPKNVAVPQKRVSVSKMFLGFGKVR